MITISLIHLQKTLKKYYLPYEISESIPLFSNFDVDQSFCISGLTPHTFHENIYTIKELLCIENANVYHSIILSDKQYSLIQTFEGTQRNEGNLMFILMYYFIFVIMLYSILNVRVML